jgi:hypothetical protein
MTTPISTWLAEVTQFTLKLDTADPSKTFASVALALRNLHEPGCAMTVKFWTPYSFVLHVTTRDYLAAVHDCTCGRVPQLKETTP